MARNEHLQERHGPIDIEIVQLLLSVIPEDWFSIRLDVEYTRSVDGQECYPMSIYNNEDSPGLVMPPDELYDLVRKHSDIFKTSSKHWRKLAYNVTYDTESEDWKFTIDFQY